MEEQITITASRAKELSRNRKMLDKISGTGVTVDIGDNQVSLSSDDAFSLVLAKSVITAFNRGFEYAQAILLLKDDYDLSVISLRDYTSSKKRQEQLKGRVIGSRGMIKEKLMRETGCYIKVYGKNVSILGPVDNIPLAEAAIEMILNGAKHDNVFSMINKKKVEVYRNGNR